MNSHRSRFNAYSKRDFGIRRVWVRDLIPIMKKSDESARLEKTIQFYEWALANYAEFQLTERKPRTKANLQKRLVVLQEEMRRVTT